MNKGKWLLAISCLLIAVFNSCREDTGSVGANILPNSDKISAFQTDTTKVVTSMYLKDSALTSATTSALLGSYNDPIFGEAKASIYAQVSPSAYTTAIPWVNVAAGSYYDAKVDSVVLLLPVIAQPYGSVDPQTIVVYRTDSNLVSGKAYYSDTTFKLQPSTSLCSNPIGSAQITPPSDGTSQYDTVRVKLSTTGFLKYIVTQVQGAPGGYVNNVPSNWTTTFNNPGAGVMQGIYITTNSPMQLPGQGSIMYVNLYSSFAGIYVYYHYTNLARNAADSAYYVIFPVGGSGGDYFTQFSHNYATSPINSVRPSGPHDSVPAGQMLYVQSMAGVTGRINFPNLYKNWSKLSPVVINEAELNFPIDQQEASSGFGPPSNLYLIGTNYLWQGYALPDESQSYYGGGITSTGYTFVITQYIQSVIDGKDTDRGLYLIPGNSATTANGVVLYGAQHGLLPANRASLTIYYTPLKKSP